jgi:flagellar motor component MotA
LALRDKIKRESIFALEQSRLPVLYHNRQPLRGKESFSSLFVLPLHSRKENFLTNPLNIVFIGAHPDDIEQSMVGTLIKYKNLGHSVFCVVATDGCWAEACRSTK